MPFAMKLRAPGTSKSYVRSTPSRTNRFGVDRRVDGCAGRRLPYDAIANDDLIGSNMIPSATDEIHRVAETAPATVREGLPMDRARKAELQEQASNVVRQSLGRCRVVDRQSLAMNAAIPLEQLSDEDGDGIAIPTVDNRWDPLVDRNPSSKTTVSEEKRDGGGGRLSIDANGTNRRSPGLRAMFDAWSRVGERRDDPAHVLEFVRDCRVQIEV